MLGITFVSKKTMNPTKTARRPMTPCELEAVKCLGQVRYPPASWDKRFARSMSGMTTISDKEAPQVWRLLKRYRRQISSPHKANLLMMADELAAPDFRKQQALQRDLAKYTEAMLIAPRPTITHD